MQNMDERLHPTKNVSTSKRKTTIRVLTSV
jgi:hypothetical protein